MAISPLSEAMATIKFEPCTFKDTIFTKDKPLFCLQPPPAEPEYMRHIWPWSNDVKEQFKKENLKKTKY